MQTNLGQSTTNEDRRLRAQPIHADILGHLLAPQPENAASLASSADLFQQVFDDALQQRMPASYEMHNQEYTGAGRFTEGSSAGTWDTSPSNDNSNGRGVLDRYEHTPTQNRDPENSSSTRPGEDPEAPRATASSGTQSSESTSSNRSQDEHAPTSSSGPTTQEKTTGADTPAKAAASSSANTPGTPSPNNATADQQAIKTAAAALPSKGTIPGTGTSAAAQVATANGQALARSGQGPSEGDSGATTSTDAGTGKALTPSLQGMVASQNAPLPGALSAPSAGKLANAIRGRSGAKLSLSVTTGPAPATGVAVAAAAGMEAFGPQGAASLRSAAALPSGMPPGNTLAGQITQSMQTAVRDGARELVVQLHPAELGRIAIRFRQDGDQLIGMIQVSERQVRADIEQAIPQILQNLEQSGTQVRRIDVQIQNDPDAPQSESGSEQREAAHSEAQQHETSSQGSENQFEEDPGESTPENLAGAAPGIDAVTGRVNMLL